VKIEARARGYQSFSKTLQLDGDDAVKIRLHKAKGGGGNGAGNGPGSVIKL
jgi:hypothetical protein